jgi:hypothetical protein
VSAEFYLSEGACSDCDRVHSIFGHPSISAISVVFQLPRGLVHCSIVYPLTMYPLRLPSCLLPWPTANVFPSLLYIFLRYKFPTDCAPLQYKSRMYSLVQAGKSRFKTVTCLFLSQPNRVSNPCHCRVTCSSSHLLDKTKLPVFA